MGGTGETLGKGHETGLTGEFAIAALQSLASHVAVLDAEGTIVAVNAAWVAFAERNGLRPEARIVGANYLEACEHATGADAGEARAIAAGLREVMAGRRECYEHEYTCRSPDAEHWFLARFTRSAAGGRALYVVEHQDVTERRREQARHEASARLLRESEAMLRKAQEVAQIGSFIFDHATASWTVSPVTEAIFGMRPQDRPTYDAWKDVIHPDDHERVVAEAVATAARQAKFECEYRIIRGTDGMVRWVYALSEPDSEGRRTGVVQDITDRKLSELALRESELRFRALVDSEMDAIVAVDEQFRVRVFNAAAEQLFGVAAEYAVGSPVERFIPQRFRDGHAARMREFGETRTSARRMAQLGHVWALRADGTEVPVEASISHVRTQGGVLYTAVLRDITERLRVEAEIRDLNRDLEQRVAERTDALTEANRQLSSLVKELEAFSYSVSHDLRAPLRAIGGFSRMVVEDEGERLSADGRRKLDVVERNAARMGQLIDDLLALARINRSELERRPTDLAALAADVAAELAGAHPQARVDIAALPRVEVDPTLVRQALLNLVGNALKYSAKMPEPRVEVGWDAERRALRVKDNGIGFDMRYAGKLFGMFQRLHADPQYEGTGVGLAIVKRVVERHGGRAWAQSAPGEGAAFFVSFEPDAGPAAP